MIEYTGELVSGAVGLLAGAVGDRLAVRRARRQRDEAHAAEAATAILAPLRALLHTVRVSGEQEVHPRRIGEAWLATAAALDEHAHRLPDDWGHLRRSLRAALGEYAGGVSMSDITVAAASEALAEFSHQWWDNAVAYMEHVADRLARWRDQPEKVGSLTPRDFDDWLRVRRERSTRRPRLLGR